MRFIFLQLCSLLLFFAGFFVPIPYWSDLSDSELGFTSVTLIRLIDGPGQKQGLVMVYQQGLVMVSDGLPYGPAHTVAAAATAGWDFLIPPLPWAVQVQWS